MSAEILQRAFASTASVLAKVSPDQMGQATPCASWTVHELVNHTVGGTIYFAAVAETGAVPSGAEAPDFAAGDYRATFRDGSARAVAAFAADGAMEKTMTLPFGELPGSVFVLIAAIDTYTHGWDLAKATGQSTDLDPELAAELLQVAKASLSDGMRGPDGAAPFGPAVAVSQPATAADELAGFMGRQP